MIEVMTQLNEMMRGVEFEDQQLQSKMEQELITKLNEDRPLIVKLGIDPTASGMHLGHTVPLRKLRQFQDLGHIVTFLIGDFTATIGDPAGRSNARPAMARKDVLGYATQYYEQAGKILDMGKAEVLYNSNWLRALGLEEVIRLTSKMTLSQVLNTRHFKERFDRKDPIYINELLYPMMQAYDSVELNADVEIGGTDQLPNMLLGRELQRLHNKPPQTVLVLPLLMGTDGVNMMSETHRNTIELTDSPYEMYGKIMHIPDELIIHYFVLATSVPIDEIEQIRTQLGFGSQSIHPLDAKKRLAREIVATFHSEDAASRSEEEFFNVHREGALPTDIVEFEIPKELSGQKKLPILELLVATGLVESKTKARGLVSQNGVKVDGVVVPSDTFEVELKDGLIIQVGRRKFVKVRT